MTKITVLIAQDHFVIREGLRLLLSNEPDMKVVGTAETGHEAVALARRFRPSVVVMDIAMPALNGLEATQQIRRTLPATRVIILSAHSDEDCAAKMARLGAGGFLPKSNSAHLLAGAIREIHNGNTFFTRLMPKDTDGLTEKRRKSRAPRQTSLDSPRAPFVSASGESPGLVFANSTPRLENNPSYEPLVAGGFASSVFGERSPGRPLSRNR